jgi:hypothetical protein
MIRFMYVHMFILLLRPSDEEADIPFRIHIVNYYHYHIKYKTAGVVGVGVGVYDR